MSQKYNITAPDGKTYEVMGPDGATQEQVQAEVVRQNPHLEAFTLAPATTQRPPASLFSSPQGLAGPGFLANLESRRTGKTPEEVYKAFFGPGPLANMESRLTGKTPEQAYRKRTSQLEVILPFLMPGRTVASQMLSQGALGTAFGIRQGRGLPGAAAQGVATGLGVGVLGAVGKVIANQLKGAKVAKQLAESQRTYETGTAQAKEAYDAAKLAHTAAVEQQAKQVAVASRAHAESSAKRIADDLKRSVPALQSIPSTEEGLISMLKGRGIRKVGRAYDAALRAAAQAGEGKLVKMRATDAAELGVESTGFEGSKLGKTAKEDLQFVLVKGNDLVRSLVGRWRKDPGLYRRGVDALDRENIGDPAARAAYKSWRGVSKTINDSGAIEWSEDLGKYVFNPTKLMKGMAKEKILQDMTRRGLGDIESGPLQAARGGPLTPRPIPAPTAPRPLSPPPSSINELPGFATRPNPLAQHPFLTGMALEGLAQGGLHAMGAGPIARLLALPGFFAGAALPKQFVTRAPLDPAVNEILTRSPGILNVLMGQLPPP